MRAPDFACSRCSPCTLLWLVLSPSTGRRVTWGGAVRPTRACPSRDRARALWRGVAVNQTEYCGRRLCARSARASFQWNESRPTHVLRTAADTDFRHYWLDCFEHDGVMARSASDQAATVSAGGRVGLPPRWFMVGMNGWGAAEPAWWPSLQAHPDASSCTISRFCHAHRALLRLTRGTWDCGGRRPTGGGRCTGRRAAPSRQTGPATVCVRSGSIALKEPSGTGSGALGPDRRQP
jgi:hypothetical protein